MKHCARSCSADISLSAWCTCRKTTCSSRQKSTHHRRKDFICTLDQTIERGDLKKAADLLVRRVTLYFDGKLPAVSGLTISRGTLKECRFNGMDSNTSGNTFTIFRSPYQNGPYETIGNTRTGRFTDTTAEAGIKYWYRVTARRGEYQDYPHPDTDTGGRRTRRASPQRTTRGHTKPWPVPATEEERELKQEPQAI